LPADQDGRRNDRGAARQAIQTEPQQFQPEARFFFELNPNRIGEIGGAEGVDLIVVEGGRSEAFFAFVNAVGGAFVTQLEAGAGEEAEEPAIAPIARHRSMGLADEGVANHDVAGLGAAAQEVAIAQQRVDLGLRRLRQLHPDFRHLGVGFELELRKLHLGLTTLDQVGQTGEDGFARWAGRIHIRQGQMDHVGS
jgi:hypothetical protein